MRTLFRLIAGLFIILFLIASGIYLTGNTYLLKGAWASYLHGHNSATIGDAKFFKTNTVEAPAKTWEWPKKQHYNKKPLSEKLLKTLKSTNSVAFLVIQNDSIAHEKYWDGFSDSSRSNSFSMAKSIVTMLTQIAIQKGIFDSWEQKVIDFLPELSGPYADELELQHLSTMSSGLDWEEHYKNPFSITAKAYYGPDIEQLMLKLPIIKEPGQEYNYQSGSTQLLGMALISATNKSLSELASEWLWKPLNAKHNAEWHTDEEGTELAYCCFNSNARDFARFGKLMLDKGNWKGAGILDSTFVEMATAPALVPYYGYSFWIANVNGTKVFYQRGILGQYIIGIPAHNLVIVRLGHQRMPDRPDHHSETFHTIVEEVLQQYVL